MAGRQTVLNLSLASYYLFIKNYFAYLWRSTWVEVHVLVEKHLGGGARIGGEAPGWRCTYWWRSTWVEVHVLVEKHLGGGARIGGEAPGWRCTVCMYVCMYVCM